MLYSKRVMFFLSVVTSSVALSADFYVQDNGSVRSTTCCTSPTASCTNATVTTGVGCYNAGSGGGNYLRLRIENTDNAVESTVNMVAPGLLRISSDVSSGTRLSAGASDVTILGIDAPSSEIELGMSGGRPITFGGGAYPPKVLVSQGRLVFGPSFYYPAEPGLLGEINVLANGRLELQNTEFKTSQTFHTLINIDSSSIGVTGSNNEIIFTGAIKQTGSGVVRFWGAFNVSSFVCASTDMNDVAIKNLTVDKLTFALNSDISDVGEIRLKNYAILQGNSTFTLSDNHDIVLEDGNSTLSVVKGATMTIGGDISGAYPLAKRGQGALVYAGSTSYTGKTTIYEGILVANTTLQAVDSYGLLRGSGTVGSVVIKEGGGIAPGNSIGTLTVNGDLSLEGVSAFFSEFDATSSSLVNVSGAIDLGSEAILRIIPAGNYTTSLAYDILTGASLTGTFASARASAGSFTDVEVEYSSTAVTVNIIPRTLDFGNTGNANADAVANSLTEIIQWNRANSAGQVPFNQEDSEGLIPKVIVSLLIIDNTDLEAYVLDQLQPAALKNIAVAQESASIQVQQAVVYRELANLKTSGCALEETGRYQFWMNGMGNFLYQSDRDFAGSPQVGYKSSMVGFAAGGDYRVLQQLFVGAFGGYTSSHVNQYKNRGTGDVATGYLGVYATAVQGIFYGNVSLSGGWSGYSAHRYIQYAAVDEVASNNHGGSQFLGHIDVGLNIGAEDVTVRPFNRFDVMTQTENSYTETGASQWNLSVQSQDSTYLRNELGLLFGRCKRWGSGAFRFTPKISWVRETRTNGSGYTAAFAGAPEFPFEVTGYFPDRDLVSVGALLTGSCLKEKLGFSLYYDGEFGGSFTAHKFGGEAAYRF